MAGGVEEEVPQLGSQVALARWTVRKIISACECIRVFFFFYHPVTGSALGIKIEIGKSLYKLKSVNSATLSGN